MPRRMYSKSRRDDGYARSPEEQKEIAEIEGLDNEELEFPPEDLQGVGVTPLEGALYAEGTKAGTNYNKTTGKEKQMDVQKIKAAIDVLKSDLGDGLLATDIFGSKDGQSIAGYNTQPKGSALFSQMTHRLQSTLQGSGFPGLGRFYILDLVDEKMVIVMPMGDYQWGMLVDGKKTQLGLLMNVVMPKIIDAFEEAITG